MAGEPTHESGRLLDNADVVLDLGTPAGDALVVDRRAWRRPVAPGSTLAAVALVNEIKAQTACAARRARGDAARAHERRGRRARKLPPSCSTPRTPSTPGGTPGHYGAPDSLGERRTGPVRLTARPPQVSVPARTRGGTVEGLVTEEHAGRSRSSRSPPFAVTRRRHGVGAARGKTHAKFVLGVSNTLVGNGWREEMICAVKAQAAASGVVSKVIVAEPQRRAGRAGRGHPQPDLGRRERDHHQPVELDGAEQRHRAGRGPRCQGRLGRPAGDGAPGAQRHERPGRLRPARRGVAVQADRRQGQRRRDARHRRRPGGHRPPYGLHAGPEEVPGHQGRQADLHRLAVRAGRQADARHPQLRRAGRRRLDVRDRLHGRQRVQDRRQAVRADRRRGQQPVPEAAPDREGPPRRWRSRTRPRSAAPARRSRSSCCRARASRPGSS